MAPAQGWGFLGGSVVKNPPANTRDAGDKGLIPGLGRSLEKEMAACSSILAGENSIDSGAWRATFCGVTKSQTQLNT